MLSDLLAPNLRAVFCGTAAGTRSAARGQYYAGRGNRFWKTLYEVGLTPHLLDASEYKLLLFYEIGLTDIVKDQSGMDGAIDFRGSVGKDLREKILRYQPKALCFNGKRAAQEFLGKRSVAIGLQDEKIRETKLFVTPSTSGAANASWDISVWQQLAQLVHHRSSHPPRR